jgi:hypothetical protein
MASGLSAKKMRRALALLLLVAHATALAHLAVSAHVTSPLTGAVVDADHGDCAPVEQHGSHELDQGCEHDALHGLDRCEAVAFTRSIVDVQIRAVAFASRLAPRQDSLVVAVDAPAPLEVLSVAPKSSPPV